MWSHVEWTDHTVLTNAPPPQEEAPLLIFTQSRRSCQKISKKLLKSIEFRPFLDIKKYTKWQKRTFQFIWLKAELFWLTPETEQWQKFVVLTGIAPWDSIRNQPELLCFHSQCIMQHESDAGIAPSPKPNAMVPWLIGCVFLAVEGLFCKITAKLCDIQHMLGFLFLAYSKEKHRRMLTHWKGPSRRHRLPHLRCPYRPFPGEPTANSPATSGCKWCKWWFGAAPRIAQGGGVASSRPCCWKGGALFFALEEFFRTFV